MSAGFIGAGLDAFTNIITTSMTNSANNNINKDNIMTQILENEKNRKWQSEENRKANEWQEKMWNAQNEYNTPLAQRQRLQAAGYNPWISGSGGPQSLAGSAGPGAHGSAPQVGVGSSIPMMPPNLGGFMQALVANSGIANQNAKTLNELLEVYSKARARGMSHDDAMKMVSPFTKSLQGLNQDVDLVFEGARTDFDRNVLAKKQEELSFKINSKLSERERLTAIEYTEQAISEMVGHLNLMSSQADLNRQKIEESLIECVRKMCDAYKLEKEGNKYRAEAQTIDAIREDILTGIRYDNMIKSEPANDAAARSEGKSRFRNWLISDEGRAELLKRGKQIYGGSTNKVQIIADIWSKVMPSLFTGSSVTGNGQRSEYGSSSSSGSTQYGW